MHQQKTLLGVVVSCLLALVLNTSLALAQTTISNGDVVNVPTTSMEISLGDEGMVVNQYGFPVVLSGTPTSAEFSGDFSALLPGQEIINPTTGQPFPNNRIPQNIISPYDFFVPLDGNVTVGGSLPSVTVDGAGSELNIGSTLTINSTGALTITNGGAVNAGLPGGSVTNSGTVLVGSGSSLAISPRAFIEGGSGAYTQTAGSTKVNGELTAPGGVNINGGTLAGAGTVNGNVINVGTVAPGDPVTLTVNGDFTQESAGSLLIDISSATDFTTLNITGDATLDGMLDVAFLNGYVPDANADFPFLNVTGNVSGDFAGLNLNGVDCPSCTFDLSTLDLDIGSTQPTNSNSVPEPSSGFLLGMGLLGLLRVTRLRTRKIA